jgi:nitrogen fixation NifU-like protein
MSTELYREIILDHYHNPQHRGRIHAASLEAAEANPLCGDTLSMQLIIEQSKVTSVVWEGQGCAISQAAADMLADELIGMTVEEARRVDAKTMLELLGIDPGPARMKCALLALATVEKAIGEKDESNLIPNYQEPR